jgi:hypothetical protein
VRISEVAVAANQSGSSRQGGWDKATPPKSIGCTLSSFCNPCSAAFCDRMRRYPKHSTSGRLLQSLSAINKESASVYETTNAHSLVDAQPL